MAMRVTTSSMVRNYNTALSSTLTNLNRTRETVYSGKKFTRAYQDPSGALRASELWRKYDRTESYLSNVTNAEGRLTSADSTIQQMTKLINTAANDEGLKALGNSTADSRKTHATTLRELQNSLVQMANTKYGESYLFAGAGGDKPPFAIDANGTVTYRGIDVNDSDALKDLLGEKLYMNLGMGLEVDQGSAAGGYAGSTSEINGASAFDIAINGLSIFGHGTVDGTPTGTSKNVLALLGQMADELENPNFDNVKFTTMREQLVKGHSDMTDYNAELGVRSKSLEIAKGRLTDEKLNTYTQIDSIENANPADAITDYSYSSYVYNMVLKVGTSLLTSSFIDFMK